MFCFTRTKWTNFDCRSSRLSYFRKMLQYAFFILVQQCGTTLNTCCFVLLFSALGQKSAETCECPISCDMGWRRGYDRIVDGAAIWLFAKPCDFFRWEKPIDWRMCVLPLCTANAANSLTYAWFRVTLSFDIYWTSHTWYRTISSDYWRRRCIASRSTEFVTWKHSFLSGICLTSLTSYSGPCHMLST